MGKRNGGPPDLHREAEPPRTIQGAPIELEHEMKKFGNAVAYLGKDPSTGKGIYKRLGTVFKDETGRMSMKIDTLPLPSDPWTGWINIFNDEDRTTTAPPAGSRQAQMEADDVPF